MANCYHKVDDNIKIDFKVPNALKELMDEADALDMAEDSLYDYRAEDIVEVYAKNFCVEGSITSQQWDAIARRYRI